MNIIFCSHLQLLSSFCWAKVLKFIKRYALFVDFCWYLRDWQEAVLVIFSVMFAGWEVDPGWQRARPHDPVSRMVMVDCFRDSRGRGQCYVVKLQGPGLAEAGAASLRAAWPIRGQYKLWRTNQRSEQCYPARPLLGIWWELSTIINSVMSQCHTLLGLKLAQNESSNDKTFFGAQHRSRCWCCK